MIPGTMKARLPSLSRYAGIYAALVRYSLIHEMQFKVNFLLNIASHDLWTSFAKLPSQVRANRIQQHNHQQMMMMMQSQMSPQNNE